MGRPSDIRRDEPVSFLIRALMPINKDPKSIFFDSMLFNRTNINVVDFVAGEDVPGRLQLGMSHP